MLPRTGLGLRMAILVVAFSAGCGPSSPSDDSCAGQTCDDGNECTDDVCTNGSCTNPAVTDGTSCDGGNGTCQGGSCELFDSCAGVDCSDENECTSDTCTDGTCSNPPVADGTSCDSGSGTCQGGSCELFDPCAGVDCSDGKECTSDVCADGTCSNPTVTNGTSCDSGNGTCQEGICEPVSGPCMGVDCSDGEECTSDVCTDGNCSNPAVTNGTSCDSGNGICQGGTCEPFDPCAGVDCSDGNECTSDVCTNGVCTNLAYREGQSCDGGTGTCRSGMCQTTSDPCAGKNCSDGEDCTSDVCTDGSCTNPAVTDGTTCDGGNGTCQGGMCEHFACDDLAEVGAENQVAIIERDLACIPAFVAALEAEPWTFLEAFYLLIGSNAATDALFSTVYDELRFDRFRFTPDVVDDLFANLPAAVAGCQDHYRCADWADWILSRLYVGAMFLCPETAGLGADELILSLPYGDYACTEALAEALAPLATSDTITDLLDLLVTHMNGWSRRNAARVLGRFAGRSSSDSAGALVLVTRAQDVTSTLLGVLQSDTEEDVLHDVIWVLDSFFYPFWSMLADLERLSLDSQFSSQLRFRAAAAVARLLSAHTGILPQADVDYILAALQTDDSWVRAEAAFICETLSSHHLSPSIEAQLIAGLQAAWAVETELHAQVYIARALDHFNGNTALFDQLLVDYEASHLANTASGSGILIRSGLPSADLPPFVSLMEDERAAFFDIMGSPFDTLVPGDPTASMTLFLFATRDEYQEYMAAFVGYGSQAGGLYIEAEGRLYTYERTPQQSTLTVEELVQHEFGHYLQASHVFPGLWGDPGYFDEPKAWADEGMAEYLAGLTLDGSGVYTPTLRQVHLSTICSASYRSLDSLLAQRAGYDEAGTFDYANGWAFVYYMISNRMNSVLSLYGAYRDNTYSLSGFTTIAGVTSLSVLEADWHGAIAGWCSAPSGPGSVMSSEVGDSARQPTRDAHDAVTRMGARPHLGPPVPVTGI